MIAEATISFPLWSKLVSDRNRNRKGVCACVSSDELSPFLLLLWKGHTEHCHFLLLNCFCMLESRSQDSVLMRLLERFGFLADVLLPGGY